MLDYEKYISRDELTNQLKYYLYQNPEAYEALYSELDTLTIERTYLFYNEQITFNEYISGNAIDIEPKMPKEKKLWKLLNIKVYTKQPKNKGEIILYKAPDDNSNNISDEIKKIADTVSFITRENPTGTTVSNLFADNFDYSKLVSINDAIPAVLLDNTLLNTISNYFNSETTDAKAFQKFYKEIEKSLVHY